MRIVRRLAMVVTVVLILVGGARSTAAAPGAPAGQMTWAVHVSLAPTWFDPAETSGTITSYMVLYALHDAMVKPMPGMEIEARPPPTMGAVPSENGRLCFSAPESHGRKGWHRLREPLDPQQSA